jgi:endonuclease YncB( thermonuclease family)
VREKIIGRKVDFTIEYMIKERKYVTIHWEESTLNLMLVQNALAKALEKKSPSAAMEPIAAASKDCETRKVGVWSDQRQHLDKHIREVTYFGESGYNASRMLDEGNKEPKPLASILEHVFGPTFLSLYVYKLKAVVKLSMIHVYVPKEADPSIVE